MPGIPHRVVLQLREALKDFPVSIRCWKTGRFRRYLNPHIVVERTDHQAFGPDMAGRLADVLELEPRDGQPTADHWQFVIRASQVRPCL